MRAAALLLGALAAGCASSGQALNALHSRYVGQSADLFFSNYGPPVRTHALSAGGYTSLWASPREVYAGIPVQCALIVNTDGDNRVTGFRVHTDTFGRWVTSRCAELFK